MNKQALQSGFTLMEIIVATAIFVTTVSAILVLFTYTLRINQEVQINRQATQGARNFTEILAREIRNGKIDYGNSGCNTTYSSSTNQRLAIITNDGDELCFYLDQSGVLYLRKDQTSGGSVTETISPENFVINPANFKFIVRPVNDPDTIANNPLGLQPMVVIIAEITATNGRDTVTIPYQTTITSDVYDIPDIQS